MGPLLVPAPWKAKTNQKYHSSFSLIYLCTFFERILFENRRLAPEKGSTGVCQAVGSWTGFLYYLYIIYIIYITYMLLGTVYCVV